MFSILSLVNNPAEGEIQKIMDAILPVKQVKTPIIWKYPHFTWHSAEDYDRVGLEKEFKVIANQIIRFTVRVTGLGVFTGKTRILFLPILKTTELADLQQFISTSVQKLSSRPSEYCTPEKWIPHITILSNPEDQHWIPDAIQKLTNQKIDFEMEINNIAFGQYTGDEAEIIHKYTFQ